MRCLTEESGFWPWAIDAVSRLPDGMRVRKGDRK